SIIMPRPAYFEVDTEGAGPWGGNWSRDVDGRQPASQPAFRRPAPRKPSPRGEITVHYDDGADDHGLRIGAKLSHPNFGVGEVRAWQGAGKDLKVTIRFPKAGVKTILARFLTKT